MYSVSLVPNCENKSNHVEKKSSKFTKSSADSEHIFSIWSVWTSTKSPECCSRVRNQHSKLKSQATGWAAWTFHHAYKTLESVHFPNHSHLELAQAAFNKTKPESNVLSTNASVKSRLFSRKQINECDRNPFCCLLVSSRYNKDQKKKKSLGCKNHAAIECWRNKLLFGMKLNGSVSECASTVDQFKQK